MIPPAIRLRTARTLSEKSCKRGHELSARAQPIPKNCKLRHTNI